MSKATADIYDWKIVQIFDTVCLLGNIRNHSQRQEDFTESKQQVTSPIVKFDKDNGLAYTLNTVYTLK